MPHFAVSSPAVERVLGLLENVKAAGEGKWMALCPVHDDRQRSLSLRVGDEGQMLMFCHAGCKVAAVVAALGLQMTDLFADTARPIDSAPIVAHASGVDERSRLVKSYDYYDADGDGLFQVCRFEPKTFRQRRRNGNGEWTWNLEGVTPVLYRLPEIMEAVALERRIYIVEGEKDADALTDLGLDATTSPMGAGKWRESYSQVLSGADVVILPDNDDTGRAHAQQVAASLTARGCTVRVVELPNLPPKGDLSDWLTTIDPPGDLNALETMVCTASVWTAAQIDARTRTRWRLDDLWANTQLMQPPPPVVPYLAWEARTTLLAAREKSGKSTLTGFVAAMVSRGGEFLGEPCTKGPVLIVGLEEYLGDTARRLKEFGAIGSMVWLVDRFMGQASDRPSEVRAHIEAVAPVLVIVDSLIAYARGLVADANNATQTQSIVQSLADLSHQTGAAMVLIHHARKADGKYRDSSAIGGAVDVIAEVFPPEEHERTDPTRRRVRPIGRVPGRSVDFRFTGTGYEVVDGSGPQKAPLEQRIADAVRANPLCSTNKLCAEVGEQRQAIYASVERMLKDGRLVNDGTPRMPHLRLASFPSESRLL